MADQDAKSPADADRPADTEKDAIPLPLLAAVLSRRRRQKRLARQE